MSNMTNFSLLIGMLGLFKLNVIVDMTTFIKWYIMFVLRSLGFLPFLRLDMVGMSTSYIIFHMSLFIGWVIIYFIIQNSIILRVNAVKLIIFLRISGINLENPNQTRSCTYPIYNFPFTYHICFGNLFKQTFWENLRFEIASLVTIFLAYISQD